MKILISLIVVGIIAAVVLESRSTIQNKKEVSMNSRHLNILILQDISGSTSLNAVPMVNKSEVEVLIKECSKNRINLNLALGIIDDYSAARLLRLNVEPLPIGCPVEPNKEGKTIFQYSKLMDDYKKKLAIYKRDSSEYEQNCYAAKIVFFNGVDSIANLPKSNWTDILGGLVLADRYFSELPADEEKYLLLLSDGMQSMQKQVISYKLKTNASVFLVNSSTLRNYTIKNQISREFESMDSALRYILNNSRSK